ncbi:MAG: hypothetical protein QNJ37_12810 [Crocosphaera sp.]|nr:hypothetical protein [Crocosphaera sp.]
MTLPDKNSVNTPSQSPNYDPNSTEALENLLRLLAELEMLEEDDDKVIITDSRQTSETIKPKNGELKPDNPPQKVPILKETNKKNKQDSISRKINQLEKKINELEKKNMSQKKLLIVCYL